MFRFSLQIDSFKKGFVCQSLSWTNLFTVQHMAINTHEPVYETTAPSYEWRLAALAKMSVIHPRDQDLNLGIDRKYFLFYLCCI
jgi:hypothetical protein